MAGELKPEMSDTRRRARRRSKLTIVGLSVFLVLSLVVALAVAEGWIGGGYQTGPTANPCPTRTLPSPSRVSLNVYNGTETDGLAKGVAAGLASQGFRISQVMNDPERRRVRGNAEIRHGENGADNAQTVGLRFPGAKFVKDERKTAVVDVVIGPRYRRLAVPNPSATPGC